MTTRERVKEELVGIDEYLSYRKKGEVDFWYRGKIKGRVDMECLQAQKKLLEIILKESNE